MNPTSPPSPSGAPAPGATLVLDQAAIERCLKRIAHEIIERNPDLTKVALIGIPSRGIEVAKRLAAYLAEFTGTRPFTGVVDVAMHRDDLHRHRLPPRVERTILPLELDAVTLI